MKITKIVGIACLGRKTTRSPRRNPRTNEHIIKWIDEYLGTLEKDIETAKMREEREF